MQPKEAIVVTGAIREGIGEAITRKLIAEGYFVYGSFELEERERASAIQRELGNLSLYEVDHSSRTSLSKFLDCLPPGPVRGLVNAAFFFQMENLENFDFDTWDRSLAVNLSAPNFLIHALKGRFVEGTSIVNITSTEAFIG